MPRFLYVLSMRFNCECVFCGCLSREKHVVLDMRKLVCTVCLKTVTSKQFHCSGVIIQAL